MHEIWHHAPTNLQTVSSEWNKCKCCAAKQYWPLMFTHLSQKKLQLNADEMFPVQERCWLTSAAWQKELHARHWVHEWASRDFPVCFAMCLVWVSVWTCQWLCWWNLQHDTISHDERTIWNSFPFHQVTGESAWHLRAKLICQPLWASSMSPAARKACEHDAHITVSTRSKSSRVAFLKEDDDDLPHQNLRLSTTSKWTTLDRMLM